MRWPWQKEPDLAAETPTRVIVGPTTATPAQAPSREQAEPLPSPAGWAFLPPLQRTVGDLETTTAPHRFMDRLPTRTNPSFTGTMSHLIREDAPTGVIDLDGPGAGPVPERTGPAGTPVEMTLLRQSTPRGTRGASAEPVQRVTAGAPAVQQSLTSVPRGDFSVLELPALPDTHDDGAGAPQGDHDDAPADPADVMPATVGPRPNTRASDGTAAPARDGGAAPTASGVAAPGPSLPLQRRTAGWPGIYESSTFDGRATSVPLPVQPTVQRSISAANAGAPPTRPPAPLPPFSRRPGVGRPWPEADPPSTSPSTGAAPTTALQRAPELPHPSEEPGRESADARADPDPGASTPPTPGPSSAGVPASLASVPPRADLALSTGPAVSRSVVSRSTDPERAAPAGARLPISARFPDPPRSAGGQTPDRGPTGAMPVVIRSAAASDAFREQAAPGSSAPGPAPQTATAAGTVHRAPDSSTTVPFSQSFRQGDRAVAPSHPSRPSELASTLLEGQTSTTIQRPGSAAFATARSLPVTGAADGPGGLKSSPERPRTDRHSASTQPGDLSVVSRSTASSGALTTTGGDSGSVGTAPGFTTTVAPESAGADSEATDDGTEPGSAEPTTTGAGAEVVRAGPQAADADPEGVGFQHEAPALVQRTTAARPAHPPELFLPTALPVVSHSADVPAAAAVRLAEGTSAAPVRATVTLADPGQESAGPAPKPALSPPQVQRQTVEEGSDLETADTPRNAGTLTSTAELPLRRDTAGVHEADGRADAVPGLGVEQRGPAESPVPIAAMIPAGGADRAPSRPGLPSPVGAVQRSAGTWTPAGPSAAQDTTLPLRSTPVDVVAPPGGPRHGVGTPSLAWTRTWPEVEEHVTMRLALPTGEPPAKASPRGASFSAQDSVQRQETAPGATIGPRLVHGDGGTAALQREAAGAAPDSGSTTVPVGSDAEPGPAPEAAPGPPDGMAMSPEQIDELAKRLVAPIVRRIKSEMLLDRERRGLRIDLS